MRWLDWGIALTGIAHWLKVYEAVDLDFDVDVNGIGAIGRGRLRNVL